MDIDALKRLLNEAVDQWNAGGSPTEPKPEIAPEKELPKDKRVVRTKTSGDRVYYLDEVKKTRAWVSKPEILDSLGFSLSNVVEIDDTEFQKYAPEPALYKMPDA